jgi:hypothetical protein
LSKVLKIAAIVVGVAAVVLTAGTALFGAAAIAGVLGVTAGTLATISTVLGVAAAVLNVAAGLAAPKPGFAKLGGAGSQLEFSADPTSGEPYVMGSARVGMDIVHEASWGDKNRFLGLLGVISCAGPIMAYDGFYADNSLIGFSAGNASGYYANFMYLQTQLGARPEAAALAMTAPDASAMPDWGSTYKLSSLAAAGLILVADVDNGKIYSSGAPKMTHQVRGVNAYDPRGDGTNGGSGAQRALTESTYVYSDNPWVHHGTFAIGRWVNGVRVIGAGLPSTSIDWASHIEAANVADANGWSVSGRIMSTDRKWDVLKSIAQAGGGYPIPSGAKLACLVNTPRVSVETIEEKHLKGPVSVPQMAMRRDRLNGAVPRYREPGQAWEIVSGATIRNSSYLTADGGVTRTKEIDLPLVADKDQAAQLVGYEVANSRERSPISLEVDLYWSQYKMGDCLTLNLPSALLFNQKAVIISRELDAASNTVRFEFRTEDDAKHTWALGLTGTSPSTTVGSAPGVGDLGPPQTQSTVTQLIADSSPVGLTFSIDATGHVTISNHSRVYADKTVSVTGTGGTPVASGGVSGDRVFIYYDDASRLGGAVTYQFLKLTGGTGDTSPAFPSATHPYRHFVCQGLVPASGSTSGGSGAGAGGGSGGGVIGGGGGGGQIP